MKAKVSTIISPLCSGMLIIALSLQYSCIEEFEIPKQSFQEILIVEGTITNELKIQTVAISKTSELGGNAFIPEENAEVIIFEGDEPVQILVESQPGIYTTVNEFSALPNTNYKLEIKTARGNVFNSESVRLTGAVEIDELSAQKTFNDDGIEGIEITISSFDTNGNSNYYRFSYNETYKIIAPRWNQFEAYIISEDPPQVDIRERSREEQVCYASSDSETSILFSTSTLDQTRITELPVRFIEKSDFIIAHRYSIEVTQLVQSERAFDFYRKLKELSSQGNLLSPNQPGFLKGNIFSSSEDGSITGYFEVSSVSKKRIFFNFEDFFDDTSIPSYPVGCDNFIVPQLEKDAFGNSPLIDAIKSGNLEFFNDTGSGPGTPPPAGPFILVPRICGDCNVIGDNTKPDFWVE